MVLQNSQPRLIDNFIFDNDGIGLFIRDKSKGEFKKNVVTSVFASPDIPVCARGV